MKKILIVDDELPTVMVAQKILEHRGYEVVTADNGVEGLAKVFEEKPDLILLDLMMPKMSGYRVIETLKENVDTRHIPVVAFSAKAWKEDIEKGLSTGADYYLTKPFDPFEFADTIAEILENK